MSSSQKYVLVDHWMLFKRAQEEVKLLKGEMKQDIAYLVSTRSVLSKNQVFNNGASKLDDFLVGKSLLSACEITRLDVKIRECLKNSACIPNLIFNSSLLMTKLKLNLQ